LGYAGGRRNPGTGGHLETSKPFAEACERNRRPILGVLKRVFSDRRAVLEIGSGTGQHAAYFAPELPHLTWQASDVAENLPGIRLWEIEPIELDVDRPLPEVAADAVFSANTAHILSWPQVERMFESIGRLLPPGGLFALYGPFYYGGKPTSESNARFDAMLRARDPASGVRNLEDLRSLAQRHGMQLAEDNPMPANNRLLVFQKLKPR
jgi:SAM-dependent methyltransferase